MITIVIQTSRAMLTLRAILTLIVSLSAITLEDAQGKISMFIFDVSMVAIKLVYRKDYFTYITYSYICISGIRCNACNSAVSCVPKQAGWPGRCINVRHCGGCLWSFCN